MAIFFDLMKGDSSNDVWNALREIGFLAKNTSEWHVWRYSYKEFQQLLEKYKNLPDTIIVHGEGLSLIKIQMDLEERGVHCHTPVSEENLFYTDMIIHHFVENKAGDVLKETSSAELSTSNSNVQPQS